MLIWFENCGFYILLNWTNVYFSNQNHLKISDMCLATEQVFSRFTLKADSF